MAFLQINGVEYLLPASYDKDLDSLAQLRDHVEGMVAGYLSDGLQTFQVRAGRGIDTHDLYVRVERVWSGMVSGPDAKSQAETWIEWQETVARAAAAAPPQIERPGGDPTALRSLVAA